MAYMHNCYMIQYIKNGKFICIVTDWKLWERVSDMSSGYFKTEISLHGETENKKLPYYIDLSYTTPIIRNLLKLYSSNLYLHKKLNKV